MSEKGKIYFVSDVHLGAPALNNNRERELLFASWLDKIKDDVDELYLLGDIFDFWYEYKKVAPRGFTRILGRLADISDSGVPIHYFTGNHDLWVYDYLPEELGVKVYRKEQVKEIRGKKFLLGHGDGLDENDTGYHRLKKIFVNKKLQWIFSRLHPNFALYIAHKWSESTRLAKIGREEEFNVTNEGLYKYAQKFLQDELVDYFIFGHRHQLVDAKLNENTRFILLGDWINKFSYGVFDGQNFELKKYKN